MGVELGRGSSDSLRNCQDDKQGCAEEQRQTGGEWPRSDEQTAFCREGLSSSILVLLKMRNRGVF